MDGLVKLINFIRSHSALQHRHFKEFLSVCDSAYLLQHNNVRWLSKGQVIERFWLIKEQVTSFLQNSDAQGARKHFEFITNERNMLVVAFLKDILKYLNALNTELQGNGKLICDLIQSVSAFHRKLDILKKILQDKNLFIFRQFLNTKRRPLKKTLKCLWNFWPILGTNLLQDSKTLQMEIIYFQEVCMYLCKCIKRYPLKNYGPNMYQKNIYKLKN